MRRIIITLLCLGYAILSQGQVNEEQIRSEAEALFEGAQFVEAHPLYAQLLSLHPRSEEYNFRFGAATIFSGSDYETAVKHLKFATHKTGIDSRAFYYLGLANQLNYNFAEAIQNFNNFKNLADAKTLGSFDVNRRIDQCKNGQGLLSKVKDIVVINKTGASTTDFFRYFDLDGMGGRILAMPEELKTKEDIRQGGNSVIYYPGSTAVIYYASYGKDSKSGKDLYRSYILPDGSFSKAELLKGAVNTPYDEDYPFMHPDGKTLYFCSKGHSSMGGYDVFRSIYDESTDSFSPPENMDFAINTPDDELLFVTDSLGNMACFASGRSSALGELNVYKVRVQGIPVQVVFIQGSFVSEIAPEDKKVRITVKDELTGRPIDDTFSSVASGEYVISLPKSGKYLFEVETANSPIIHEGLVEVPSFGEPVVLKQELRIIKEGGTERLIINNQFDTPMTDRVAEYTASMMRKMAGLDVNATPELLAQLDDGDKMTVEKSVENAPMLAGFSEDYSVETIVSQARNESQEKAAQAIDLNDRSAFAAGFANAELTEAKKLLEEASELKAAYNGTKDEQSIDNLRRSQRLAAEAERKLINANNAIAIADSSKRFSSQINNESLALAERASIIESQAKSGNVEALIPILKEEKQRREKDRTARVTPGEKALDMAELKSAEGKEILNTINRLRAEDAELTSAIKRAEREKETAKNKEKVELESRISALKQEKNDLAVRLQSENERAREVELVSQDFRIQSELYDKIVLTEEPSSVSTKLILDANQKASLSNDIELGISQVAEIKITDPETLALVGSETRVTSEELTTLLKLPPVSQSAEVELKPVNRLKEDYESAFLPVSTELTRPEFAYKARLIQVQTLQNLESREQYIQSAKLKGDITEAEAAAELEELNAFRSELQNENRIDYTPGTAALTEEEQRLILEQINPEYKQSPKEGIAWKDGLMKLKFMQASIDLAEEQISLNNQLIIASNNPEQIKELRLENEGLSALIESLPNTMALDQIDREQMSAMQALGSGNDPLDRRIEMQIEMTEDYLDLLDEYESGLNSSKINASEAEKREYTTAISQLNELKESAQLRLSGLNSDREIALADISVKAVSTTENQPETTASQEHTSEPEISESLTANNPATERSAPSAGVLNPEQALPRDKTRLILTVMPDYPLEGTEAASRIANLEQRKEIEQSFITLLTKTIQERERFIVETNVPEERERVEVELSQLRALKRQSELKLLEWKNAEVSESSEIVAADLGMKTSLSEQDIELFEEISQADPSEDPKSAYEGEFFEELLAENTKPSLNITNLERIREVQTEIRQKESQLLTEESEGKKKKLDRQIEGLYTDVAAMEIGNASKLKSLASEKYEENVSSTENLKETKYELLKSNSFFDDKLDDFLQKAEENFEDASKIRENAARIADPIEKNYRLREAFALEREAIQNQEKALTLLENIENLTGKEELYLASLNASKKSEENLAAINQLKKEQEEQEAMQSQESSIADSPPLRNSENEIEEIIADTEIRPSSTIPPVRSIKPELESRMASVTEEDPFKDSDLSAEEIEIRRRSAAYVNYEQLLQETENRRKEIESAIAERNDLIRQTQSIEDQIAKLEVSINAESNEAVRDGLKEEQRRLRAQAQVNYRRIELLDDKIESDETLLGGLLDEAVISANRLRNDPGAISAGPIAGTRPDDRARAATARNYLFEYPNELTEDLFAVLDKAPYSDSAPIPIDPAMPAGVVFKVQVGAFRNEIPQDLFGGFAPISGETLNSGITRYTVGLFRQFPGANLAKAEIQSMGYPDAFVVAFIDGIRVPLYDALARLGDEATATINNETRNNTSTNSTQGQEQRAAIEAPSGSTDEGIESSENLSAKSVGREFDPSREDVAYYEGVENAAKANQIESLKGLFYTVQVGVYSKVVSAKDLLNISPLNSELTTGGRVRYTTGVFNNLTEASLRKEDIKGLGITDAFVTAYYNGQRVTLQKASDLYEELGPSVLNVTNALSDEDAVNEWEFDVFIGQYSGEVPANVAKAMLFLEESRGIIKRQSADGVEYYSGRVNSLKSAKLIQEDFKRYDVNSTQIMGYENGLKKPLDDYTGE